VVDFSAELKKQRARISEIVAELGGLELEDVANRIYKLERQLDGAFAERDRVVELMREDNVRLHARLRANPRDVVNAALDEMGAEVSDARPPAPRNFDGGEELGGEKLRRAARRASLLD